MSGGPTARPTEPSAKSLPPHPATPSSLSQVPAYPADGVTLGGKIDGFEVVAVLGPGPLGTRYRVTEAESDRDLELVILPELILHAGEEALRGLLAESRRAVTVRHPNLLALRKVGKSAGQLYLATDHFPGDSAADDMAIHGPMTPREAVRIAKETADALAAVHKVKLTHRDIRPENMLLGPNGEVRLAGLGLSRALEELQQFRLGIPLCSPHYCSPEHYQDGDVDNRSDVYSLGAALFCLLTGRPPFTADTSLQVLHKHCAEPVPDPRADNPQIPEKCFEIVAKAMAKKPADRYPDVGAMAAEMSALLEELPLASGVRNPASSSGIRATPGSGSHPPEPASSSGVRTLSSGARTPATGGSGVRNPARPTTSSRALPAVLTGGTRASDSVRAAAPPASSSGEYAVRKAAPVVRSSTIAGSMKWVIAATLMGLAGLAAVAVVIVGRQQATPPTPEPKEKSRPVVTLPPVDEPSDPAPNPNDKPLIPDPPKVDDTPPEPPAAADLVELAAGKAAGWQKEGGDVRCENGAFKLSNGGGQARATARLPGVGFDLSFRMASPPDADAAGVEFHHRSNGHMHLVVGRNGVLRLIAVTGSREQLATAQLEPATHEIRLSAEPGNIWVFVDGKPVLHETAAPRPDPEDRRLSLAVAMGEAEFAAPRLAPRGRSPVEVRRQALEALVMFADPTAPTRLAEALRERGPLADSVPDAVRRMAELGGPDAAAQIAALVGDDLAPPAALRAGLEALGGFPGHADGIAALEKRLSHSDPGYRAMAALSLAKAAPAGAVAKLRPLVSDKDPTVRRTAIRAVAGLRTDESFAFLTDGLRRREIRLDCAKALLEHPERPEGLEGLLVALSSPAEDLRNTARALLNSRRGEFLPRLADAGRAGRLSPERVATLNAALSDSRRLWRICGPFPIKKNADPIGRSAFCKNPDFSKTYPGTGGRVASWRELYSEPDGRMNFKEFYKSSDRWAAYGYAVVLSDRDKTVDVPVHIDDDFQIWVNDKSVATVQLLNNKNGTTIKVPLKAGPNTVFFVIENSGGGDWYARVGLPADPLPEDIRAPGVLCLLDDDGFAAGHLAGGEAEVRFDAADRYAGAAALFLAAPGAAKGGFPGWSVPIAENPGPGQYRYVRFAIRSRGAEAVSMKFMPRDGGESFRYVFGPGMPGEGKPVADAAPSEWTVWEGDLFADFGAFTLTGLGAGVKGGEGVLIDHVYLARTREDLERIPKPAR